MEISIIAPIKMLDFCCTRTHYVLPSLLLESEEYLDFYIEKQKLGHTIVMDCTKIGWKREPELLETTIKATQELSPEEVILPSLMYNLIKTKEVVSEYLDTYWKEGFSLVGCLEGTSLSELEECRDNLVDLGIKNWALPAHCYRFSKKIENISYYIDNWESPSELKDKKGVLFTSLPVRLGLQGRLLSNYKPTPPLLTFKEDSTQFGEVIRKNIEEMIEYYDSD